MAAALAVSPFDAHAARKAPAPAEADLSTWVDASPWRIAVGEETTFTVTVTNAGPATATQVTLTDSLTGPAEVVDVSTYHGKCSGVGSPISCGLDDIPSGASAHVTIRVRATDWAPIENRAEAAAAESDPSPSNNSAWATVDVAPHTDVSVDARAVTAPTGALTGFTYEVRNRGAVDTGWTVLWVDTSARGVIRSTKGTCRTSTSVPWLLLDALARWYCDLGPLAAGEAVVAELTVVPVHASLAGYGGTGGSVGGGSTWADVWTDVHDSDYSDNEDSAHVTGVGSYVTTCPLLFSRVLCPRM